MAPRQTPPESNSPPPEALAGFANLNRFWDHSRSHWVCKILPGELYVTRHPEFISTVLGSCISACIYDVPHGIGGMNHFMLPDGGAEPAPKWSGDVHSATTRFGAQAMEQLLQSILDNGGTREALAVKIFGGGKIMTSMADIGRKNIRFAEQYLRAQKLTLAGKDVGDPFPRRILFDPLSGQVWVKKLRALHNNTIIDRERQYRHNIKQQVAGG